MTLGYLRALRFARGWRGGGVRLLEHEGEIRRPDGPVSTTLLRPAEGRGALPGWVVLHGITRPGRKHPTLLRFVRALARSGAVVLVPEVPEWKDLILAPREARETVRAAVGHLAPLEGVAPGGVGVMGFSFGVPRALEAGADTALAGKVKGVAGFGGYADMERTLRFLFTGEHDWKGRRYRGDPDPYGRWVVGGNLLHRIPDHDGARDVSEALLALARAAGDAQVGSWEAHFDAHKEALEREVAPSRRALFRAFATPAGQLPPPGLSREIVAGLHRAALASEESFEPLHLLPQIRVPVHLIHGREDRLIPFTETLRLREAFPPGARVTVSLTGLFSHSYRGDKRPRMGEAVEGFRFLGMLARVLSLV